ncbi:MAG: hypothetical protein KAH32_00225 [Chlamydiia bacterium]|nr:hypothetical protein [Chlamydiia bacterium]
MKHYILLLIGIIFSSTVFSQNEVDILRYSQYQVGGTARSIGFGGALGSIGADFSSLTINPAGIGLYRKSVFSITPTVFFSNTNSKMGENSADGFKDNFNLNQYGAVFVTQTGNKDGWKAIQFGIGVNRTNNYNQTTHIVNNNDKSSLMTDYINQANGQYPENLDPFSTDLAWYNWLIDTLAGGNTYFSNIENGGVRQELKKENWGSVNEMTINLGGSYSDIFYIGASMGFPFARYFEETEYSEFDDADTIANFNSFIRDQYVETHGNGFNLKIGIIIRPTGFIRVGLAFHSPTWYNMNDQWNTKITRYWDDGTEDKKSSPHGEYNYNLTTPMKLNGSLTFTIARFLLLSSDIDYINYSSGRLEARDYDFFEENAAARDLYKSTVNIRAGAEIRLRPISLRLGMQRYGNAYKDEINSTVKYVASAGIGYRTRDFFMDMAYSYSLSNSKYYMYDPSLIGSTDIDLSENRIVLTAGYKF